MISKKELEDRIVNACENVIHAEAELTEIDSKFGDADHGLTMHKIAEAIKSSVKASEGNIKEMLDDAAMAVMGLNGGSAVPLWNTWLDGMQEGAPEADEIDVKGLKEMFASRPIAATARRSCFPRRRRRPRRAPKTARTSFPSLAARRATVRRRSGRRTRERFRWQSSLKGLQKNNESNIHSNTISKGDWKV